VIGTLRRVCLPASVALALALAPARSGAPPLEITHTTPPPQPPLTLVEDSVDVVRSAFNAALDRPRLLLLFSPT
jgi:hypothetical protein